MKVHVHLCVRSIAPEALVQNSSRLLFRNCAFNLPNFFNQLCVLKSHGQQRKQNTLLATGRQPAQALRVLPSVNHIMLQPPVHGQEILRRVHSTMGCNCPEHYRDWKNLPIWRSAQYGQGCCSASLCVSCCGSCTNCVPECAKNNCRDHPIKYKDLGNDSPQNQI